MNSAGTIVFVDDEKGNPHENDRAVAYYEGRKQPSAFSFCCAIQHSQKKDQNYHYAWSPGNSEVVGQYDQDERRNQVYPAKFVKVQIDGRTKHEKYVCSEIRRIDKSQRLS